MYTHSPKLTWSGEAESWPLLSSRAVRVTDLGQVRLMWKMLKPAQLKSEGSPLCWRPAQIQGGPGTKGGHQALALNRNP